MLCIVKEQPNDYSPVRLCFTLWQWYHVHAWALFLWIWLLGDIYIWRNSYNGFTNQWTVYLFWLSCVDDKQLTHVQQSTRGFGYFFTMTRDMRTILVTGQYNRSSFFFYFVYLRAEDDSICCT